MTTERLVGSDGHSLEHVSWPVDSPRGRLLILHGLGEHGVRYELAALAANAAGFEAHALNQRGHGRSTGIRGHAAAMQGLVSDVGVLRRRVESHGGRLPTWLLGHSLGGLVALRYLQGPDGRDICAGVLVAPFLAVAMTAPSWKKRVAALADRSLPFLTLDNGIQLDDRYRSPEERSIWKADTLVHKRLSVRMWGEMQRAAELAIVEAERLEVPLLFQVPGDDRIVRSETTLEFAARLVTPVRVIRYPAAFHDLYRDPEGSEALKDLGDWLRDTMKSCDT